MKNPDGQTSAVPSSTPDVSDVLTTILDDVRAIVFDAQYSHDRVAAVLVTLRELLFLTANNQEGASRLNPDYLGHVISDALTHLKVIESQLLDLEVISNDGSPERAGDRHLWQIFRHLWAICDREERRLILKTMRTLEERVKSRGELRTFLQDLTAKPEGGGDE